MSQRIVGVDLGGWSFKAAVVASSLRSTVLERFVEVPVELDASGQPAEGAVGCALIRLREEIGGEVDIIHCGLNGSAMSIRQLDFPAAAFRKLDQILPFELDGQLPFDLDESIVAHRIMNRTPERLDVLALVVPKERVEKTVMLLSEVGLDPRTITYAPLAYEVLVKGAVEPLLILDMGHTSTNLCFIQNGRSVGGRTLLHGGRHLTLKLKDVGRVAWEVAERGKISGGLTGAPRAAEVIRGEIGTLMREVRQSVAAHVTLGWEAPRRLFVLGGGSDLKGVHEALSSEIGIPVEPLDPFQGIGSGGDMPPDRSRAGLAVALARSDELGRDRRVDFRRDSLAYRGDVDFLRKRIWYIAACVAALLLAWIFSSWSQHRLLMAEKEQLSARLAATTESLLGESLTDTAEIGKRLLKRKVDKAPIPPIDGFDVLDELSRRISENLVNDIYSLEIKPTRIVVQGEVDAEMTGAETQLSPIDLIKKDLSDWKECITAVKVGRTHSVNNGQRLDYSMEIETRCPGIGKAE